MCKILVQNFIIKDILKKKNDVHCISVRTITFWIVNMTLESKVMVKYTENLSVWTVTLTSFAVFNGGC